MKKKINICPLQILVLIINNTEKEDVVETLLNKHGIEKSMISTAKGTANSTISDFFGFGIVEKLIISTFIPADKAKVIINDLVENLKLKERNKGIVFTLPLTSISSNILQLTGGKK